MAVLLYLLPSIIILIRKAENKKSVILINIFFGWTFIGWLYALVKAFNKESEKQRIEGMSKAELIDILKSIEQKI